MALLLPAGEGTGVASDATAKPARHITGKIVKVSRLRLQIRVHVEHYHHRHTFLDKKRCVTCAWHVVARKKTTRYGRVFYTVGAPAVGRWFWRVGTPQTPRFRTSFSPTFFTYRL
jgi:hypothetical protein